MIKNKKEKLIIKQFEAICSEFNYIVSDMVTLKDYFEKLIEYYKKGNYSK